MSYTGRNPNGQATSANSEPVVIASDQSAITTKTSNGTNTADVIANDSGLNGVPTNNSTKTLTFSTSSTGVQTLLANTDVRGYSTVTVVTTGIGTGLTWLGQFAPNSGGTFISTQGWEDRTATGSIPGNMGTSNNHIYMSPTFGDYFQLAVSALTGGTLSGYVILSAIPVPYTSINVAGAGTVVVAGTKSNNAAVPGGSNLGVLPFLANATKPVWTEGDQVTGSVDLNGNQRTRISDAAGNDRGANVDSSNNLMVNVAGGIAPTGTTLNTYSIHLTSNTTTTPTSSTAYISSVTISNEVGGTTSTITIQDKQGTPLKLINGVATTALTTAPTVVNFQTPVKMVNGIDIITAGAVAATVDVWINYYQ